MSERVNIRDVFEWLREFQELQAKQQSGSLSASEEYRRRELSARLSFHFREFSRRKQRSQWLDHHSSVVSRLSSSDAIGEMRKSLQGEDGEAGVTKEMKKLHRTYQKISSQSPAPSSFESEKESPGLPLFFPEEDLGPK